MRRLPALLIAFAVPIAAGAQEKDKTCGDCSVPSLSSTPRPTTASAADPAAQELRRLDAEVNRVILAGDRPAVAALLDDGMVFVGEDGSIRPGQKLLENLRPPRDDQKTSLTPSEVSVRFFGDTALVTSRKTRSWEADGETNSVSWHETNTWVRRDGRWKLAASTSAYEQPPYAAADVAFDLPYEASQALGAQSARIVLYEFSDYECSFCRRFAHETLAMLEQEYVRSGKVALVYRDNPLDMHPRAMPAAVASHCAAAQGKLWAMNERLLRDPMGLSDEDLARNGREIGLDPASFDHCRQDPETAARIRRDKKEATAHGVKGTPSFVVAIRKPGEPTAHAVRIIAGAQPYDVFQRTLDGLLRVASLAN